MRTRRSIAVGIAVAMVAVLLVPARPASAATSDVSADIAANRNIVLAGDAAVRLTGG